jgi:hypothetical protein
MIDTRKHIPALLLCILIFLISANLVFAVEPSSASYALQDYSFGAGSTASSSSNDFSLNGIAGEVEFGRPSSSDYTVGSGLTYLLMTNVPGAPVLSTPADNYDRILFVINTQSNPSDTTYALEISTDPLFQTNVDYIKQDGTVGTTLALSDYKTYQNWGGASGTFVTGLNNGTTYYIRAKASQGAFSESGYGPSSSITTNNATLTFTINNPAITFNHLNSTDSYTDSSQSDTLTTTTNAYNGYVVYGWETQPLTSPNGTISNYASPNSTPTAWAGTGFGYTTNDTNLTGTGGPNRFNNGTFYAGFLTAGPGDPVASDLGPVQNNEILNEQYTISYRVQANSITPAGTYTNTILYTIVPTY